jgi:chloride channel protein, CIC family
MSEDRTVERTASLSADHIVVARSHAIGLFLLSLLGILMGIGTGLGAVGFRMLIAVIHNATFLGMFSFLYDANVFTAPSPWGALIILVPVIGSLVVTFLVINFAPEARGHGVPEVMDAIYYNQGVIRPIVAAVKSLASATSIGTGGSVGREGPIIQIGASIGSTLGQYITMAPWQRITLVAAGAGAGIAATFNTPIGGVMFAIELMLPEVSVRTFLPVALSTGTATFVGRMFLGAQPAFYVPPSPTLGTHAGSVVSLILYAILGAMCGLASTGFIRGLHWAEGFFESIHNSYLRHAIGMLGVGVLIYALFIAFGHYYVEGVGYATIQAVLLHHMDVLGLLALLFAAKLAATVTTLGSGASGGIFSPSLFMGATMGGALGAMVQLVHPMPEASIPALAIVGMAAMVGGGTGAVMTAVTMLFEMTRDYEIVMPMILAVAVSVGVRRMLSRENIYTIKLVARRHFIPKALHANMFLVRSANEVMDKKVLVLPAETRFDEFLKRPEHTGGLSHVVVTRGTRLVGVLRVNTALRRGLEDRYTGVDLGEVAQRNFTIARPDDIAFDVIRRMWQRGAAMAVVVKGKGVPTGDDVVGIITKEHVADSVADSIIPYGN